MRLCLKIILGILLLVVVLSVISFYLYFRTGGGAWVVQLPGNYQMSRAYGNSIAISRKCDGSDVIIEVIGPPVDGYAVYGHVIVGHVGKPESDVATQEGYFLIDTRKDFVKKKLSKCAFQKLASNYGLPKEPNFCRPSRWTQCRR